MTDEPKPEDDMSRSLNTTKLREVVGSEHNQAESREVTIHTRAQQRLADDMDRAEELDGEIAKDQDYAARTRSNIADLQRLLAQTEANIKDAEAERQACLVSVHNLRVAGITI